MDNGKINVMGLALAFGISCGFYAIFIGVTAWIFNWGNPIVAMLSSLYIGYKASLIGSIIGGLWAFVDGFIGGAIIAWLYNKFVK